MATMKTKEEIGKFIKERIGCLKLRQSDLAAKIALLKGDGYSKDAIKDNVSKWIRGERYPGTEYIYYLSQVLELSVEEILVAGDVCDKYDNRPFSLYAVARSGNIDVMEELMNTYTPDGSCIGTNYDEYDKTILDYIIEFERIDLLKFLINKGYLSFFETQINTVIRIGGQCSYEEMFKKIISLAIKYDEVDVFKHAIKRTKPIIVEENNEISTATYRTGYVFSKKDVEQILDSKLILEYLVQPFVTSEEEWKELNPGIIYIKPGTREELNEIKGIEVLSLSFNVLLDLAKSKEHSKLNNLLDIAREHNIKIKQYLEKFYSNDEYKISPEGIASVDKLSRGCITVFGCLLGEII